MSINSDQEHNKCNKMEKKIPPKNTKIVPCVSKVSTFSSKPIILTSISGKKNILKCVVLHCILFYMLFLKQYILCCIPKIAT